MAKTFQSYEPNQYFLMPPRLDEWLPDNHLAYFIGDVVDELDVREITEVYEEEERGYPPYHPVMMIKILLYGYCVGIASSRRIAKELEEDVAFRVLAAENRPDFRTISDFRKRHLKPLSRIFLQVLRMCQEAGLVKVGHVGLDGTKVKANASKHKAMSYGRMCKAERELEEEVGELLKKANEVDAREDELYGPDKRGDELPKELARRETRLKKIRDAKKALEEEARREAERKRAERAQKEAAYKGRKPPGRKPKPVGEKPEERAQYNFTDPDSRIMKGTGTVFLQAYNAQAAVDGKSQVIVACDVINNPKDGLVTVKMVDQVQRNTGRKPKKVLADAGNYTDENVEELRERGIDVYITPEKTKHSDSTLPPPRGRIPKDASTRERMIRKLRTKRGRAIYARRKVIPEPVFGQIKAARGFDRFLLRGMEKVRGEWTLICLGHNLLKLFRSGKWVPA
jgi:transposase